MSPQTAETRNAEHIFALIFTLIGGIFWVVTAFMGSRGLTIAGTSTLGAFQFTGGAILPLVYTLVVLVVGWANEKAAAIILTVGAIFTVLWGIVGTWAAGVWGIMVIFFLAPTIIAAVLFWLAAGKREKAAPKASDTTKPATA